MILYKSDRWYDVIFATAGTVWPHISSCFFFTTIYALACYGFQMYYQYNVGSEGRTILMGTMSFLLIFRANAAYARYWEGRKAISHFFSYLREFVMLSLVVVRGGIASANWNHGFKGDARIKVEDHFDRKARDLRVDVVRLCVALAVSFKLHTRIALNGYCFGSIDANAKWRVDWDRFRLRQLLSMDEFLLVDEVVGFGPNEQVQRDEHDDLLKHFARQFRGPFSAQGPQGPPDDWPTEFEVDRECHIRPLVVISGFLRELMFKNINDMSNNAPWAFKERYMSIFMDLIGSMLHSFEQANQIITTPIPLPYANLCKTLLTIFLLSMPFFVDYRLGWISNTLLPPLASLALLGIDAIATELENPFGDDDNDLDILEPIHVLECEALEMLRLTGDSGAMASFCWRRAPEFVEKDSCRDLRRQLAIRELAAPEVVTAMSDGTMESWMGSSGSWRVLWSAGGSSADMFETFTASPSVTNRS